MRFFNHPFVLFALLFFITISSFAESNTVFYFSTSELSLRPTDITKFFVAIILLLMTIGYWVLSKRANEITWKVFIPHLVLTIPSVLFIRFSTLLLNNGLHDVSTGKLTMLRNFIYIAMAYSL